MMKEERIPEAVQKYADNLLSKEEREEFDRRIREDKTFAKQVEDYSFLLEGLNALGVEAFEAKVRQWEKEYKTQSFQRPIRKLYQGGLRRYYAVAAVIIMLIFPLGFLYLNQMNQYSGEELYAQNFEPYQDLLSDRDASGQGDEDLLKAMEYYNNGFYENAVILLEAYVAIHPDEPLPGLYLGISYLETGQIDKAMKHFEFTSQDPDLREMAEWYTALALVKAERMDEAKTILAKIANSEIHYRRTKAKDILDILE
ncbi:MAG: hypothetical protein R3B93_22820 [Bacteroidia bacterium]